MTNFENVPLGEPVWKKSLRMNSRSFEKSHNEGFRIYTKILVEFFY